MRLNASTANEKATARAAPAVSDNHERGERELLDLPMIAEVTGRQHQRPVTTAARGQKGDEPPYGFLVKNFTKSLLPFVWRETICSASKYI
jgi:hypothetical protein